MFICKYREAVEHSGHAYVYNTYATLATQNPLFQGFSRYQRDNQKSPYGAFFDYPALTSGMLNKVSHFSATNVPQARLLNATTVLKEIIIWKIFDSKESGKARYYKGYRGCGLLSDVLCFRRYATHMQQVCNTNINDMYRTFSEKSGNVLSC